MTTSLHIYLSPMGSSSRCIRQARAILRDGIADRVEFMALEAEPLPAVEEIEPNATVRRIRLWTRGLPKTLPFQLLKYVEWMAAIIFRNLMRNDLSHVQAHSIAALGPALAIKLLRRIPVIYDAHELETEQDPTESPLRRHLARAWERIALRFVDAQICVSSSIAEWYASEYRLPRKPVVVRNIPEPPKLVNRARSDLRRELAIPDTAIIFLYLGGAAPGRGVESVAKAFHALGPGADRVLVVLSPDADPEEIGGENVFVLPPVAPDLVVSVAREADVGICLIENTCLSYYYCLPNKFFEYLHAGLPVISSDFPELRRVIQQYDCGWLADPGSADATTLLQHLSRNDIDSKRDGVTMAAAAFQWPIEADRYIRVLRDVSRLDNASEIARSDMNSGHET